MYCKTYSADSYYNITISTKATLHYSGQITWEPPAIFKSMCQIDVRWYALLPYYHCFYQHVAVSCCRYWSVSERPNSKFSVDMLSCWDQTAAQSQCCKGLGGMRCNFAHRISSWFIFASDCVIPVAIFCYSFSRGSLNRLKSDSAEYCSILQLCRIKECLLVILKIVGRKVAKSS